MDEAKIIKKAQAYLKHSPIDSVHDYNHHKNVARNCQMIIEAEHLDIDFELLNIAAWWHDMETQQGATNLLKRAMKEYEFSEKKIAIVISIINSHTYGKKQFELESQVLFDADKMEYFNPERMMRALEDTKIGKLSTVILRKHTVSWLQRHQKVLDSLNFKYSKKIALDNLAETKHKIDQISVFLENHIITR